MKTFYRHGDIPVVEVKTLPKGKKLAHNGSFTIALGEATGHHHRLTVKNPDDLEIVQTPTGYVFRLKSEGRLSHEEHGTITIKPGTYKSYHEREYDYFAKSTRRVID